MAQTLLPQTHSETHLSVWTWLFFVLPILPKYLCSGLWPGHSLCTIHISWARDGSKLHGAQGGKKNIISLHLSVSFFHILGFLILSRNCLFQLNYSNVFKSRDSDVVSTKWILDFNHAAYRFTIQQRFLDSLRCLPIYTEIQRTLSISRHQC